MRIWPHILAGLAPVVVRLALLAWYPAPLPAANPPHPMTRQARAGRA